MRVRGGFLALVCVSGGSRKVRGVTRYLTSPNKMMTQGKGNIFVDDQSGHHFLLNLERRKRGQKC